MYNIFYNFLIFFPVTNETAIETCPAYGSEIKVTPADEFQPTGECGEWYPPTDVTHSRSKINAPKDCSKQCEKMILIGKQCSMVFIKSLTDKSKPSKRDSSQTHT